MSAQSGVRKRQRAYEEKPTRPVPVDATGDVEALERTSPHSIEAERAVLGAIILDPAVYDDCAASLESSSFFRSAHGMIWEAITALLSRPGGRVDTITLCEEMSRRGTLEDVRGPAYLSALIDGVPRSVNAKHYAEIVREKALLRALILAGNRLTSEAYFGEKSPDEILRSHDAAILALQKRRRDAMVKLETRPNALAERIESYVANKGKIIGVTSGYPELDELTLGFQPGDVVVIAARPSIGKTTLVMNIAEAAARSGRGRVLGFSIEQGLGALELRLLSAISGQKSHMLKQGYVSDEGLTRISQGLVEMGSLPISINDLDDMTTADIRISCRKALSEGPIALVFVDYFQLLRPSHHRRDDSRTVEFTVMSRELKGIAKELQVPILLLSQLSRAGTQRYDPKPALTDLRETGALEQDADVVLTLHRRDHRLGGITLATVLKHRDGPTGEIELYFDRDITRFLSPTQEQIDEGREQERAAKAKDDEHARTRAIIRARANQAQDRYSPGD